MSNPSVFSAIQKLRFLLTRSEKLKCVKIVILAVLSSLLEVVTATLIVALAQVLSQPEVGRKYLAFIGIDGNLTDGQIVSYIAIIVGVVYLIKNLLSMIEVFYQNTIIQRMNYNFKSKILKLYSDSDYILYLNKNASRGYNIIEGDVHQMFSSGMVAFASILSEGLIFVGIMLVLISINPSVSLIMLSIGAIVSVLISKVLLPIFYKWGVSLQELGEMSTKSLLQFFHGFKEIVLLGKRESFVSSYRQHAQKKSEIQAIQTSTNTIPRMLIEVIFVGLFVITITILCFERESPMQMIGTLGGYLYAGFRLMPGLNRIINQLNNFKTVIPSIERVYSECNSMMFKDNYINIEDFKFNRSISLSAVYFSYPSVEKDTLKNINIEIEKGQCIGIIGESGSGKSTLIDIILGLIKNKKGTVLVDGKFPVNSYQWHNVIGYVPQSVYLIDDTIEANIAFGENQEDVDMARVNEVIDAAQLRTFINQLADGIHTIVGDRGVRLSGGERQRIAIARALYRKPEVLIFDEATSALDNETESRLMETIYSVSKNRTVIMIAHRLSTLKNCDRIINISHGQALELTKSAV